MASGSFALPWPQHPVPHYYHNNWVTSIKVLPKWIASKVLPFPHTDPKIWYSITKYGPQFINISPILHPNKTYLLTVKNQNKHLPILNNPLLPKRATLHKFKRAN